jgi:hypothetical protein
MAWHRYTVQELLDPPPTTPTTTTTTWYRYTVQELLDNAAQRVDFIMPEDAAILAERGGVVFVDVREPPEW